MRPLRLSLQLKLAVVLATLVMLVVGGGAVLHRERLLDNYVPVLAENQEALARSQAAMVGEEAHHALALLEASAKTLQGHQFSRPDVETPPGLAGASILFDLLVLIDPQGVVTTTYPSQSAALGLSVAERDYFLQAIKGDRAVVGEPVVSKVDGEPALPMAVAVRDTQGRLQGVLAARMKLSHPNVLRALGQTTLGQGGHFELVTTAGAPVYLVHPDRTRLFAPVKPLQPEVNVRDRAAMSDVLDHPDTPVVAVQAVPGIPWAVRVVQPARSALAPVVIMKQRTVPAVVLFALAAGTVTWFAALYLLAPLRRVHRAVSGLASDPEASAYMGSLPNDEVGDLGTEFSRLMERVRQRETELEMTQAAAPLGIFRTDPQGQVLEANDAYRRKLGLEPGAALSDWLDMVEPEHREAVRQAWTTAVAEATEFHHVMLVCRADGRKAHLAVRSAPIRVRGHVIGHTGTMADISRAKAAEQALRQSEAQLRLVADNLPALMYLVDADERFVFANQAFQPWLGLSPEEVVGRKLEDVFGRDAMTIVRPNFLKALTGVDVSYERELPAQRGLVPVQVQMRPHRDPSGAVAGLLVLLSDVSDQKRAAEALRASEERMRSVADQLPLRVAYVDAQQRYQFNNAVSVRALERTADELRGATVRDVLGPEAYALFEPYIARALQGETVHFEREVNDARGYRHETVTYLPQLNGTRDQVLGFIALIADGTSQKLTERRLLRMAQLDSLTGLHNRAGFDERLAKALANCRTHTSTLALLYLDIDKFKSINDTYGHQAGDSLLKQFAQRLAQVCRATDIVTRLGGDEFTVIMERVADDEAAAIIGNKVVEAMRVPFVVDGHELVATTSVGIALYGGGPGVTSKGLVECADKLLYAAKREGRNSYQVGWAGASRHSHGQPVESVA